MVVWMMTWINFNGNGDVDNARNDDDGGIGSRGHCYIGLGVVVAMMLRIVMMMVVTMVAITPSAIINTCYRHHDYGKVTDGQTDRCRRWRRGRRQRQLLSL